METINCSFDSENCHYTKARDNSKHHDEEVDSSVVFEYIPQTVKQMWIRANSFSEDECNDINKEHQLNSNANQNMMEVKHNQPYLRNQILSQECGDVLISHDMASEVYKDEQQQKKKKFRRNESVSESPELPVARNKWGIDLKHIVLKEKVDQNKDDGRLPFGFPKLRKLSETNSRPRSMSDEFILENRTFKNRRSRSFDILDNDDGENNNTKYTNKYKKVVQERKNSFEYKSIFPIKPQEFDQYAHIRSGSPVKNMEHVNGLSLNKKSSLFYQAPNTYSENVNSINKFTSPRLKSAPMSLEKLLKLDEMNLTVDVVEKPSVVSRYTDKMNKDINTNKGKPNDIVNKYRKNVPIETVSSLKPDLPNVSTSPITNGRINNVNNDADHLFLTKSKDSSENIIVKKDVPVQSEILNQSYKSNNFKHSPILSHDAFNSSQSFETPKQTVLAKQTKIVRKIFTSPPPVGNSTSKNASKTEYTLQMPKSSISESVETSTSNKIQYNKLGQVTISNIAASESKAGTEVVNKNIERKKLNADEPRNNSIPVENLNKNLEEKKLSSDKTAAVQHNYEQSAPIQVGNKKYSKASSNTFSKEEKGKRISASIMQPTDKAGLQSNDLTNDEIRSEHDKQIAANSVKSSTEYVPGREKLVSLHQQKRRVGKLIIMTGEQRDKQLKNLAKKSFDKAVPINSDISKRKQEKSKLEGFSLTFMSNELDDLEDDPNEPEPIVPEIIFNDPVVDLKSIIRDNILKKKKPRVTFSTKRLATLCSYPSESSYYMEENKNPISIPSSNLSTYQPSMFADLGTVIQRERERIQFSGDDVASENKMQLELQLSHEGEHFHSHHSQEGGHAMLF